MSKGAIIIGAAVIALALFYKPITDMLNGIIGGGLSPTDQYFTPRDTSRGQVGAYDPPADTFYDPRKATIIESPPAGIVLDTGEGLTTTNGDKAGETGTDTGQDKGLIQNTINWIKENPADAAVTTAFVGPFAWSVGKGAWNTGKDILDALNKAKMKPQAQLPGKPTTPTPIEESPALKNAGKKAFELGKKAIKIGKVGKVIGAAGVILTGLTVGSEIQESMYRFGIKKESDPVAKDPLEWFQKMGGNIVTKGITTT